MAADVLVFNAIRVDPEPAGRTGGTGGARTGGGRFGVQRNTGGGAGGRREDKQIDEKEIQRKIQETQAKLSGGGGKGQEHKSKIASRKTE